MKLIIELRKAARKGMSSEMKKTITGKKLYEVGRDDIVLRENELVGTAFGDCTM